jgi:hypothetical protein
MRLNCWSEGYFMKTLFLCANPSWLSGAARIFDLGGTFDAYNTSASGEEADAKAAYSDWTAVGEDLQHAIDEYELQAR